ncbi:MAG: hypothetical protein J5I93_23145 [Pirellulaceae bacterium]|nr:hypothetical protein [Pirellulaceae bacterium]
MNHLKVHHDLPRLIGKGTHGVVKTPQPTGLEQRIERYVRPPRCEFVRADGPNPKGAPGIVGPAVSVNVFVDRLDRLQVCQMQGSKTCVHAGSFRNLST